MASFITVFSDEFQEKKYEFSKAKQYRVFVSFNIYLSSFRISFSLYKHTFLIIKRDKPKTHENISLFVSYSFFYHLSETSILYLYVRFLVTLLYHKNIKLNEFVYILPGHVVFWFPYLIPTSFFSISRLLIKHTPILDIYSIYTRVCLYSHMIIIIRNVKNERFFTECSFVFILIRIKIK